MAALHTKQQRENALAIKALKDEISELKNNPSNRQQKASTALKGLKDTMSDLSSEIEKELDRVNIVVNCLDQEVATMHADKQNDSRWEENEVDKAGGGLTSHAG
ncbi:hypothetical protein [Sporisorium scitamineum]|uniref:Uncharacterized protein n=1 Tax=Sporisorium scitamineum TaxID=49012 RepID=A0A0F7S172_9BASI|nr:hypothetical protein [Sporisorium scitamineum]